MDVRNGQNSRKATIIVGEKFGRLGNRLWLFAHVVAHAIEHDLKVLNPCFDEYSGYFEIGQAGLFCKYPRTRALWRGGTKARQVSYDLFAKILHRLQTSKITNVPCEIVGTPINEVYDLASENFRHIISSRRYVVLCGWRFRDYHSFEKHTHTIRRFFRPCQRVESSVEQSMAKVRQGNDLIIGVHIRRGDYKDFLNGIYYYDTDEYLNVMRRVQTIFPNKRIRFLICSDEQQNSEQFSGLTVDQGGDDPVEDMLRLAKCDYILGPPSTFTMWASFYGSVPLYRIRSSSQAFSRDSFQIVGSRFDEDALPV